MLGFVQKQGKAMTITNSFNALNLIRLSYTSCNFEKKPFYGWSYHIKGNWLASSRSCFLLNILIFFSLLGACMGSHGLGLHIYEYVLNSSMIWTIDTYSWKILFTEKKVIGYEMTHGCNFKTSVVWRNKLTESSSSNLLTKWLT